MQTGERDSQDRLGDAILVVDDEEAMRITLKAFLGHLGYRVSVAATGEQALEMIGRQAFALVLLDLHMPGISGTDVLRAARPLAPDTVFVILTAYGTLDTAILAIRNGAFDYLLKPTPVQEIVRVVERALADRQRRHALQDPVALLERALVQLKGEGIQTVSPSAPERFLQESDLAVDTLKQLVVVRGDPVSLTPTEYDLLVYLMRHRRRVVSCRELVREIQGHDLDERDARVVLRTHIYRLRQKIEIDPNEPQMVCTVRGRGYTFQSSNPRRAPAAASSK
ncbi:MAG: response regulator transcription factor [Anaerolineae bacterium]|nr:response regulator transcription factor [Anaerolineae bacterium]